MSASAAIGPRRRRRRTPKWLLALPSIVWYAGFFALPIAFVVAYSFGTKDSSRLIPVDFSSPSWASYSAVFDETFFVTFRGTLRIALLATALCLLIGLPVAYYAAFKASERWRAVILAAVIVPSFTSFLIRTVAWRIPLAPNGTLSKWLMDLGLVGENGIQLLATPTAVQIAIVYNYLGFMILPLFVALDRIDVRMREASKDLGAGRIATFFGVTVPLAGPGIAAGVLLTFIPMCGDYVVAVVLGGAKGNMIGAMIASQFSGAQNWPLGAAMAVLMIAAVLASLVVGAVAVWLVPRLARLASPLAERMRRALAARARRESEIRRGRPAPAALRSGGDALRPWLAVWTVLVLVFLFFPILLVVLHSFNATTSFTIWSGRVSTKWWDELFDGVGMVMLFVRGAFVVAAALLVRRLLARRGRPDSRALGWMGTGGFVLAVVVNGLMTEWFRTVFDFPSVGDAIRNSFMAATGATILAVLLGGTAGVALARRPGIWTTPFMLGVPHPRDTRDHGRDRAGHLVSPTVGGARRGVRVRQRLGTVQRWHEQTVGRSVAVRERGRDAHRAGAPVGPGRVARGGRGRPGRAARTSLPPDHAPTRGAGAGGGRAVVVRAVSRQRRHLDAHQRGGLHDLPRGAARGDEEHHQTLLGSRRGAPLRHHARSAVVRGPGAAPQRRLGESDRGDARGLLTPRARGRGT